MSLKTKQALSKGKKSRLFVDHDEDPVEEMFEKFIEINDYDEDSNETKDVIKTRQEMRQIEKLLKSNGSCLEAVEKAKKHLKEETAREAKLKYLDKTKKNPTPPKVDASKLDRSSEKINTRQNLYTKPSSEKLSRKEEVEAKIAQKKSLDIKYRDLASKNKNK